MVHTLNTSDEPVQSSRVALKSLILSICLRLCSFILSQLTIRLVDPATLGRASVRLELGSSTALFLGREGFRLALLRSAHNKLDTEEDKHRKSNVLWLTVPITITLAALSTSLQLRHIYSTHTKMDQKSAALLYFIATCIESLSEPVQMFCIWSLDISSRALSEGIASIVKAFTTVLLLRWGEQLFSIGPVTSFGIAQITYATLFTMILYVRKRKSGIPSPKYFPGGMHFHGPTLKLSALLTLQSVFKHLLTEGDRIILTVTLSDYDQGIYAMASSYGSIVCRVIFQPLEENARWLFSSKATVLLQDENRNEREKKQIGKESQELLETYIFWVKLATYISLPFAFLAPNYAKILLRIVAGRKWGESHTAATTLGSYCIYVSLLGLNGITEAFVYSVVKKKEGVGVLTVVHAVIALVFYIFTPIFVRHSVSTSPSSALIFANGLSMFMRILYSIYFATSFFKTHGIQDQDRKNTFGSMLGLVQKCLPHPIVLLSFVTSYSLTKYSFHVYGSHSSFNYISAVPSEIFIHITVGIACTFSILAFISKFEKQFLYNTIGNFKQKFKRH